MALKPGDLLRLLSDPTRLRSVMLLWQEGELCVCELTYALQDIQPKIDELSKEYAEKYKKAAARDIDPEGMDDFTGNIDWHETDDHTSGYSRLPLPRSIEFQVFI